ncbi:hypothetical protein TNIN_369611 [Trichonephila inaurata madagascariensis]|uniref:Uncharacterized protein n=1 Tax=Trichonephila inaurata madagascariensis TaxID=2747483 RepID=A0A8X7C116_9ARAC|nr:hypothetical protein TNIN_369611 [Trichonephila inaurata madagascariensis]
MQKGGEASGAEVFFVDLFHEGRKGLADDLVGSRSQLLVHLHPGLPRMHGLLFLRDMFLPMAEGPAHAQQQQQRAPGRKHSLHTYRDPGRFRSIQNNSPAIFYKDLTQS